MSAIDGARGALKPAGTRSRGGLLQRHEWLRGYLLMSPTMLLMLLMLIVPIIALVIISFWTQDLYSLDTTFTLDNYWHLVEPGKKTTYWWGIPFPLLNPVYAILLVKSVILSLMATAAVILLAYPMAYFLAFRVTQHKVLWLILITIPFWTSYLLRVFAWKIILGFNGVINSGLISLGIIDEPLEFLLYNPFAVVITLAHAWAAFAILPIYVSLEKIDRSLLEAATDLGDRPLERFLHVTLPLSAARHHRGRAAGLHSDGRRLRHADPGRRNGRHHDRQYHPDPVRPGQNWPLGSALSLAMMLVVTLLVVAFLQFVGYRRMRHWES